MTVRKLTFFLMCGLFVSVGASADPAGRCIVDLTYPFDEQTLFWPTSDLFQKNVVHEGMTDAGYYYSAYTVATAEHGGTHLDAPVHFHEGGASTDQISLDRLVAPALLIDAGDRIGDQADSLVTRADLTDFEEKNGRIAPGSILLLRTGWGRYWPDAKAYLGTDARGADAVKDLHFPGLDPDAAEWLVAERDIAAIGIDTASIDYGQSGDFLTHQILAKAGIPIFENVGYLEGLPATGMEVVALPMKITGGSGGPLRIIAILDCGR